MQSTLNIGRDGPVPNPLPRIAADLAAAGWERTARHERWLKRVVIPAEVGNRPRVERELVRHLGLRRGPALDRAVAGILDLAAGGAIPDNFIACMQGILAGERMRCPGERDSRVTSGKAREGR